MKTLAEMKDAFYRSYLENEINILTNQLQEHKEKEDKLREILKKHTPANEDIILYEIKQILNEGDKQ